MSSILQTFKMAQTPVAINYKAYEGISEAYGISSATVVPAGLRTVATSGHVGLRDDGTLPEDLEAEMEVAFEVRYSD